MTRRQREVLEGLKQITIHNSAISISHAIEKLRGMRIWAGATLVNTVLAKVRKNPEEYGGTFPSLERGAGIHALFWLPLDQPISSTLVNTLAPGVFSNRKCVKSQAETLAAVCNLYAASCQNPVDADLFKKATVLIQAAASLLAA
jgi:hypothetical protein